MFTARNGRKCFLVAIEGPDRVGKATQARLLEERLMPHKATVEEVPYNDGVTYPQIYAMLRSGAVNKYPVVFQTLQGTNRRFFQKNFLPNLASHYDVLILDRWTLSTRVYGIASGVSEGATNEILEGIVEPDLTLVFDGKPFPKEGLDVWEANIPFQNRVRELYMAHCAKEPERFVKIDAERPVDVIQEEVLTTVRNRLR
jgi:dTMP kinase